VSRGGTLAGAGETATRLDPSGFIIPGRRRAPRPRVPCLLHAPLGPSRPVFHQSPALDSPPCTLLFTTPPSTQPQEAPAARPPAQQDAPLLTSSAGHNPRPQALQHRRMPRHFVASFMPPPRPKPHTRQRPFPRAPRGPATNRPPCPAAKQQRLCSCAPAPDCLRQSRPPLCPRVSLGPTRPGCRLCWEGDWPKPRHTYALTLLEGPTTPLAGPRQRARRAPRTRARADGPPFLVRRAAIDFVKKTPHFTHQHSAFCRRWALAALREGPVPPACARHV
jgi:hypothetical protein